MPHTPSVRVEHPNGIFYQKRHKLEHLLTSGRAYWKDRAQTVLVIVSFKDDEPARGYEYGGKVSIDTIREEGGSKVMQLKPLRNRRGRGRRVSRRDRLWHPRGR